MPKIVSDTYAEVRLGSTISQHAIRNLESHEKIAMLVKRFRVIAHHAGRPPSSGLLSMA